MRQLLHTASAKRLGKLDAMRGFAAVYVLIYHARPLPGPLGILTSFGQEAVILFFILSGFVVYYSTFRDGRSFDVRDYLIHRFRRIYPIFLFALLFSYLLACLVALEVQAIDPKQLAGNLMMLQDNASLKPGVWVSPLNDSPLWSLSYEWWFYILFIPIIVFLAEQQVYQRYVVFTLSFVATIAYLAHPNQPSLFAAYFIIWWIGVEFAREYLASGALSFHLQWPNLAMVGALTILWTVNLAFWRYHGRPIHLGTYPLLPVRHFGMAVLSTTLGLLWYRRGLPHFQSTLGIFAVLAPISYAIYALHYPLLAAVGGSVAQRPLVLAASLAILVPLACIVELGLQPRITRLVDSLFGAQGTLVSHPLPIEAPGRDGARPIVPTQCKEDAQLAQAD